MPARFADIKFNLMRAIELFEDMNHLDMDVTAPPSSHTFYKEIEVAQRLNIFLGQLIEEGVFDDCELRVDAESADEDEEAEDEEELRDSTGESSSPRSQGFNYRGASLSADAEHQDTLAAEDRGSRESFTDRFKRYIRRIMPGGGPRRSESTKAAKTQQRDVLDGHHHRHSQQEQPGTLTLSTGSYEDELYDEDEEGSFDEGESIYSPSGSSNSIGSHDDHPIHAHHRGTSGSTINSSTDSRSLGLVEPSSSGSGSRLGGAATTTTSSSNSSNLSSRPLTPRSRSTTASSRRSVQSGSGRRRRSSSRASRSSQGSNRPGRVRSANSRRSSTASSRKGGQRRRRSRTGSRASRRGSAASGRRSR